MYIRCLNTSKLKSLNSIAVKRGYNRALSDLALKNLDPDGIHVIALMMLHEKTAAEPHLRVMVYMKFIDINTPIEAFLDMPIDDFYSLEKVEIE